MPVFEFAQKCISDNRKFVLLIFILGFALRLAFVFSIENSFYFSDSLEYEDCALQILSGEGLGDYKRAPLYPLWMAFVYLLAGGKNIVLLRILESVIGSLISVIIFHIGLRVFSRSTGIIAALIYTVYPMSIFLPALNYPTLLTTCLISLGVYLTILLNSRNKTFLSILIGFIFGLSSLGVAPTATLILAVVIWILFFSEMQIRQRILHSSIILIAFLITLTPWTIRNYNYHHKFVPIRHSAEKNLRLYKDGKIESKNSTKGKHEIKDYLNYSVGFIKHLGRKFLQFWRVSPTRNLRSADPNYNLEIYETDKRITKRNTFSLSDVSYIVNALTFTPILIFTILGLFWGRDNFNSLLLFVLPMITLAITYSFFHAKVRYRIPIEPLMIVVAAYGVSNVGRFLKTKLRPDSN